MRRIKILVNVNFGMKTRRQLTSKDTIAVLNSISAHLDIYYFNEKK